MLRTYLKVLLMLLLSTISVFAAGGVVLSSSPTLTGRSGVSLSPSYADQPIDSTYKLGPGDFLDLILENNYLTVQVYPDGSVAIEECGAVNVNGKTLAEAKQLILDLVSKRYKRSESYVQLSSLKRFRVNALGAVTLVGQHTVEPHTRLSYFIRQIGGTLPNANTEDILVIRGADTLHIDFNAASSKGDFASDILLEQGDKVFVPFVAVHDNVTMIFSGVRTPVIYQEGRTLLDYYDMAGGNRSSEHSYKSISVKEPGKDIKWIKFSEMNEMKVAPNTEVEFSEQSMVVYVGGAVTAMGSYPYDPSWHALDYISAAGVNIVTGSWNQVKVWRGNNPDAISVKVGEDPILPGDMIEIPRSRYESFKDITLFLASLLTVVSSAFIIYVNYK